MKRGNDVDDLPHREPLARFSTPDLSDALDNLRIQGTPLGFRPAWANCPRLFGRAYTLDLSPDGEESPVEGTLRAVAAAEPGDVIVVANRDEATVNSWGGMVSLVAARRGLRGAVLGGACRDVEEIEEAAFPVYSLGVVQHSVRGRTFFLSHGKPVRLGGVVVRKGDWVAADRNGVAVVPADKIAEVAREAWKVLLREAAILDSMDTGTDAIRAHRVEGYEK